MQTISELKRPASSGKAKFFAGGALIMLAIAALIYNGIRTGGNYYLTLDELAARAANLEDQGVRVNATVDKESVDYDSRAISLTFDLVDPQSGVRRTVVYKDPMPDLFMKSESVIVEGVVNESGTLEAHTILVKCPSKYEEAQQNGAAVPANHNNDTTQN
ncbi:MAG: cytochrome c maturation protein CcmE [Ardenticatenales bacterium]|nr:cytochrome c maturation protein CcmE [Ardenticatenales bacterium]